MKIRFIFCGLLVCNMVGRARPYVAPVMDCQEKTPELVGGRSIEEGPKLSEVVRVRLAQKISKLPLWNVSLSDKTPFDWLLTPEKSKAGIYRSAEEAFASLKKVGVVEPDGLKANAYCGAFDLWREQLEKQLSNQ